MYPGTVSYLDTQQYFVFCKIKILIIKLYIKRLRVRVEDYYLTMRLFINSINVASTVEDIIYTLFSERKI
jgi:hypothetical protein